MKPFFTICIFALLLQFVGGCAAYDEPLYLRIKDADRLAIAFYPNQEKPEKLIDHRDYLVFTGIRTIKQVSMFISNDVVDPYKCGYTGHILYFKGDSTLEELEFNATRDCPHFVYTYQGETHFRRMENEGIDYFERLFAEYINSF